MSLMHYENQANLAIWIYNIASKIFNECPFEIPGRFYDELINCEAELLKALIKFPENELLIKGLTATKKGIELMKFNFN
jgi:hypothetical protein